MKEDRNFFWPVCNSAVPPALAISSVFILGVRKCAPNPIHMPGLNVTSREDIK